MHLSKPLFFTTLFLCAQVRMGKCDNGSGVEMLQMVEKVEAQAKEMEQLRMAL